MRHIVAQVAANIDRAEARVAKGAEYLDERYDDWRHIASLVAVRMADPQLCLLCWLERTKQLKPRDRHDYFAIYKKLPRTRVVMFKEVLRLNNLSFHDAVDRGFAISDDDPRTFYATLRDSWQKQFRRPPDFSL